MSQHPLLENAQQRYRYLTGTCVLLLAGVLIAIGVWSGSWFQPQVPFSVLLEERADISKGSPVTLRGYTIGRVNDVLLMDHSGEPRIQVDFWIQESEADWIREGTILTLRSEPLKSPRLEVTPGPGGSPRLAANTFLKAEVTPDFMARLTDFSGSIDSLLASTARVLANIEERTVTLQGLFERAESTFAKTEQRLDELGPLLELLSSAVQEGRDSITKMQAGTLAAIEPMVEALRQTNEDILPRVGRLLGDAETPLYNSLASLSDSLAGIDEELPELLELWKELLANSGQLTEAALNTWPFSRYHQRQQRLNEEDAAESAEAGPTPPQRLRGNRR